MSILAISDLHWGHDGSPQEFHVEQPLVRAAEVLKPHLRKLIVERGVTLLAIAGDLIHHGTTGEIERIIALLSDLPCDAIICLGNHDLMSPGAIHDWNQAMARWPRARLASSVASALAAGLRVVAVTNEWWNGASVVDWWSSEQCPIPCLDEATYDALHFELEHHRDVATILMVHAPPAAMFAAGAAEDPTSRYRQYIDEIRELVASQPQVKAIVSGHVHYLATRDERAPAVLTVSAANEKPHLGRLFELEGGELRASVLALAPPDVAAWRAAIAPGPIAEA